MKIIKYGFVIKQNFNQIFKSELFDSIHEAIQYFLIEYAPIHFPNETFTRSIAGSFLKNDFKKSKIIVSFYKFLPKYIPIKEWEENVPSSIKTNEF